MFYGLIILCAATSVGFNTDNCMVYASPTVYESRPSCYQAIRAFITNEEFVASQMALNMVPVNVKCVDLTEKDVTGINI